MPGKVKSRLAASVGPEKALAVYLKLIEHTFKVVSELEVDVFIYYSNSIPESRIPGFKYCLQSGKNLGQRMMNAFQDQFDLRYDAVCIIGSDNYEITADIINQAFKSLGSKDLVIGPSYDGGYYLLGMKQIYKSLFKNKSWSTSSVYMETLENFKNLGLSPHVLQKLRDIDVEEDLNHFPDLK